MKIRKTDIKRISAKKTDIGRWFDVKKILAYYNDAGDIRNSSSCAVADEG